MADSILRPLNAGEKMSAGVDMVASLTVGHLAKIYFEAKDLLITQGAVSPTRSTIRGYKRLWHRYLEPRVSNFILREFQQEDAFLLWQSIRACHDISRRTMERVKNLVSGMIRWAKDRGMYKGENPAVASLPEGLRGPGKTEQYRVDEFLRLMGLFNGHQLAQALLAIAYGAGPRKGELAAIQWADYEPLDSGAIIHIRQAVWEGEIKATKTPDSTADLKIDQVFCDYIEAWKEVCGGATQGLVFPGMGGRPINLDSFVRWQLRPVLDSCAICRKHPAIHGKEDHELTRDPSLPTWKGWHAFRRGNATLIAHAKDSEAARLMMRHTTSATTENHYILNTKQDRRVEVAKRSVKSAKLQEEAAGALGAAVRSRVVQ